MHIISAWEVFTGSMTEKLEALIEKGEIDEDDPVWSAPDGSYGVGMPTLEQEDDPAIMEMADTGTVAEWLTEEETE